jgi:peptidoglycan/xylan/chitin deacetylase (PgdA/CDA1 family)
VSTVTAGARRSITGVLRQATKASAAAVDRLRPPPTGIVVLIYHRVGAGSGGQMDLPVARFDEQLRWLVEHHRILDLDTADAELAGGGPVEPGVVITFDDGTTDWVDHVLPALERHRVPATCYVATDFVDRQLSFPADGRPLSWNGVRELADSDLVTIGSHTHTHALLDRLPAGEVADELDRSVELLGEHTGASVEHFAYPKAVAGSPVAEQAVRERFRTAVLAGTVANGPGTDPHRLARSPIQAADGPQWFRLKAGGGLRHEDTLRDTVNRFRYRNATT